jgi:flagellar capping protein FliD
VRDARVNVFTIKDIDRQGIASVVEAAVSLASTGTAGIHVSFDMDVCDPSIAPGVGNAVKKFASDYNKVVNLLDKNSSKSTKIEGLADSFEAIKNKSNSLAEIGVTVGDDGRLSINEDKLKGVINGDYRKVKNIFGGSSGIASDTYNKVQNAMNNSKNLYPSFQFSSGDTSIYSSNNSNIIYSQYNSIYSSGLFLNSLR